MPIQSNQIIRRRGGSINVDQTLCALFNKHIQQAVAIPIISKISHIDFLSKLTAQPLSLRLKIKTVDRAEQREHELNQLKNILGLNEQLIEVISNEHANTTEINIADVGCIIKLFQDLDYESLLDSNEVCLADQVDLLQLLITDTLCWLIKQSKISPYPPEEIEFNASGDLTILVTSPNNKKYQLKNLTEICGFFKQYCHFELPAHFIGLMRQQQKINTARYVDYLTTSKENEIPPIFTNNAFKEATLCADTQSIALVLGQNELSLQEKRVFQMLLAHCLGAGFITKWQENTVNCKLILSSEQRKGWTPNQISRLCDILIQFKLLSQSIIDDFILSFEQQSNNLVVREIPESIADILRCQISHTLPNTIPFITPTGQSYDKENIQKWLKQRSVDPMNPSKHLTDSTLRKNNLLEQLINYYKNVSAKEAISNPPDLLLRNKATQDFYKNPIVTESGDTIEYTDLPYNPEYVNRCVLDLIKFYEVILNPRTEAIIRTGIRATIGANLGVICPGYGDLSELAAKNEAEVLIPYPEYEAHNETLIVHFISPEYARRFELALLQWKQGESLVFADDELEMNFHQTSKTILNVHDKKEQLTFNAQVLIRGEEKIMCVLDNLCKLPALHYLNALKKLSTLSDSEELLNEITHVAILKNFRYDWNNVDSLVPSFYSLKPKSPNNNILSIRALSDKNRFFSSELPTIDEEPNEDQEEFDELDLSRLRIQSINEEEEEEISPPSSWVGHFNSFFNNDMMVPAYADTMRPIVQSVVFEDLQPTEQVPTPANNTLLRPTNHVHFFNLPEEITAEPRNTRRRSLDSPSEHQAKRGRHN